MTTEPTIREILDSGGAPTLGVEVTLVGGVTWRAAVPWAPSGAPTGSREAVELRDGEQRYRGKGVRRAVASVTGMMARGLRGVWADAQAHVDRLRCEMDGTPGKTRLGANATLGVSPAVATAAAAAQGCRSAACSGRPDHRACPSRCRRCSTEADARPAAWTLRNR